VIPGYGAPTDNPHQFADQDGIMDNRFDRLGDDNGHEDEAITALSQLARAHGAESRAADIVAEKALRGRYRFSPALGWLEWDGRRWDADDIAEPRVVETVRQFIDNAERDYRDQLAQADATLAAILAEVLGGLPQDDAETVRLTMKDDEIVQKFGDPQQVKEYTDASFNTREAKRQADIWLNLLSAGKIGSITKLCRGMDGIVTRSTDFDAHPDLLNCHNGVVDLRTGDLLPADPDLLLTHLAGGDYIPGASSALWDKALQAVPAPVAAWFQRRMGQSITGHTPDDDSLIVCAGGGENGKSAVMSAVMRACGTYGRLISHRVLISQPGQHPTELMDLRGLRFALLEETPEEGRLDTHTLKVTIGTPQITARRMRRDDVTFATSHSLWVNTNFLPQVDTTDHGTWRRLKAMPWPYRFRKPGMPLLDDDDREGDLTLKPKLATNPTVPTAVLAWLVEGAMAWYEDERVSPTDPELVVDATNTWRATTDVGYLFATERLAADENSYITAETMRAQFNTFLSAQGKHEWSAQPMNQRLPESLGEAGILISASPAKPAKVRKDDVQSLPTESDGWNAGRGTDIAPGKLARMWRGVRFKTDAERAAGHLQAVS
jgi:P4 family phage/plasmid primase-like protien